MKTVTPINQKGDVLSDEHIAPVQRKERKGRTPFQQKMNQPSIAIPALTFLSCHSDRVSFEALSQALTNHFALTEADLSETTDSGLQRRTHTLSRFIEDARKAKAIVGNNMSGFAITDLGKQFLYQLQTQMRNPHSGTPSDRYAANFDFFPEHRITTKMTAQHKRIKAFVERLHVANHALAA